MNRGRRSPTSVLSRAVAAWSARAYDGKLDALLDLSGNGLHARLGSAVGADTNDPLRLQFSDGKYVYFPGSANNSISIPDAANLSGFTAGITITVRVRLPDYTPAANMTFVAKDDTTTREYGFRIITTGELAAYADPSGTFVGNEVNSTGAALVDNTTYWLKASKNLATGLWSFFKAADTGNNVRPTSGWTAIGTAASNAGTLSSGASPLYIGVINATSNPLAGNVYYVSLNNGVDNAGTDVVVMTPDSAAEPYASFVCSTGQTATFNRSSSGRKLAVVDRDLLLLGTDDYLEVADSPLLNFGAGQSLTASLLLRNYSRPSTVALLAKKQSLAAADIGYVISQDATTEYIEAGDGASEPFAAGNGYSLGTTALVAGTRGADGKLRKYYDELLSGTSAGSTVNSLANALALRFGRLSGTGTSYSNYEFFGAAIFREDLSAANLIRLKGELLAL